jgi:outer membrane protein W
MFVVDLTCDYEKMILKNISVRGGIAISGISATFYSTGYNNGIKGTSKKEIVNLVTPGLTAGITYTLAEHIIIELAVMERLFMPCYKYTLASIVYPPTGETTNYYEKDHK